MVLGSSWTCLAACCFLILSSTSLAESPSFSCPPEGCIASSEPVAKHLRSSSRHGLFRGAVGVPADTNCSCNMHPNVTTWFGMKICNAPLTPSWALAVVLGLTGAYRLQGLGPSVSGSLSYSITFAMYAAMITSGLFVHCLYLVECGKAPVTPGYITVAKIDGSLTSCIALSFLFNGLVDLKVIPERAAGTLFSMVLVYAGVFVAYFKELIPAMSLYFLSIVVGCSLYLACQCFRLCTSHCRGFLFLAFGGVVGGFSLWLVRYHSCWLCQTFGAWSVEGEWYYGSDIAMLLVFLYAWNTRESPQSAIASIEDAEMKSHS